MALKNELKLRKDFDDLHHEALLGIYYTANRIRKAAAEFFSKQRVTDVQFNAMELLRYQAGEEGGLTQVELSQMMLVNRANITTLIDRMEKAGVVERGPSATDRRYNIVRLTPKGRALQEKIEDAYMAEVQRIMGPLTKAELNTLMQLLEKVRRPLSGE